MTSDSKVTSGVVYKAVLLAFGLVIAGMIFQALASLVLGVLIVAIIATPLSAFADMLQRRRVPRAIGATLGLLLGLAALAGLVVGGFDGVWTRLAPPSRTQILPVFSWRAGGASHAQPLAKFHD